MKSVPFTLVTLLCLALSAETAPTNAVEQIADDEPTIQPNGETEMPDVISETETPGVIAAAEPSGDKPASQAEPTTSVANAPKTTPAAFDPSAKADEIDLEEIDDSAEAAKKPVVKTSEATDANLSLVDISCDNASLDDILRQFRKVTDANIISGSSTALQQRVSANLHHVPWIAGLQSILLTHNFRLEERNGIYFVKEDKVAEPVMTRNFTLNHASAKELANLFNKSFGKKDAKGNVISDIATAFEGANVVVVTATEKILHDCEVIVKNVDKDVAQIYIEARFLELSSEALHKLGIQWDSLQNWGVDLNNLSVSVNGDTVRKSSDAAKWGHELTSLLSGERQSSSTRTSEGECCKPGTCLEDCVSSSTRTLSGSWSADRSGSHDSSKNNTFSAGFSGQLSADAFRFALSAFEQLDDTKIFSNPKVIVSNGREANVDMTTKFPNLSIQSKLNTESTSPFFETTAQLQEIPGSTGTKDLNYKDRGLFAGSCFYEWGITLAVTPPISPDGLISVEITPTISQLNRDLTEGGSTSGYYEINSGTAYGKYPIIQMKRIHTEFTMKDGSTAVIGGLSKTVEEDVDSGIPYLRKIPWIGPKLFGWKSRQKVQKEIIICVTLGIAHPASLPRDIGLPKNAILGRDYMTGIRLEPGDRSGTTQEIMRLDTRDLDREDPGTVVITPVRETPPSAAPAAAAPDTVNAPAAESAATVESTATSADQADVKSTDVPPSPES